MLQKWLDGLIPVLSTKFSSGYKVTSFASMIINIHKYRLSKAAFQKDDAFQEYKFTYTNWVHQTQHFWLLDTKVYRFASLH